MKLNSRYSHTNFKLDNQHIVTAYAFDGLERILTHGNKALRGKSLSLTFELSGAKEHDVYRVASGDEINWWACVCNEIPKDKYVLCSDGVYYWKVKGEWSSEGYEITGMSFVKL